MTAQSGKDLLIKIDIDGSGSYRTLAGLRASKIEFNAQAVNATHMNSLGRWRELIEGAGVRNASITGNGVFIDDESDARLQQLFFDGKHANLEIVFPDFGKMNANFHIGSMEFSGKYDGEMTYDLAFSSAGEVNFTHEGLTE